MHIIPLGFSQQAYSLNLSSKLHKIKMYSAQWRFFKANIKSAHQKADLGGSISHRSGQESKGGGAYPKKNYHLRSEACKHLGVYSLLYNLYLAGGERDSTPLKSRAEGGSDLSHPQRSKAGLQIAKTLTQFPPGYGWR